jgi:hypothetical protein
MNRVAILLLPNLVSPLLHNWDSFDIWLDDQVE